MERCARFAVRSPPSSFLSLSLFLLAPLSRQSTRIICFQRLGDFKASFFPGISPLRHIFHQENTDVCMYMRRWIGGWDSRGKTNDCSLKFFK